MFRNCLAWWTLRQRKYRCEIQKQISDGSYRHILEEIQVSEKCVAFSKWYVIRMSVRKVPSTGRRCLVNSALYRGGSILKFWPRVKVPMLSITAFSYIPRYSLKFGPWTSLLVDLVPTRVSRSRKLRCVIPVVLSNNNNKLMVHMYIVKNTTIFLIVRLLLIRYNYMFRPSMLAIFRLYMKHLTISYIYT